jgi:hypothetical protein
MVPAPFAMDSVRAEALVGTNTAVAAPGQLRVASAGVPGAVAPSGATCPASTFFDTFDDGTVSHALANQYIDAGGTIAEVGGLLELQTNGQPGYTAVRSSSGYDVRGGAFTVELVAGPAVAGVQASLIARYSTSNRFSISVSTTQIETYRRVDGIGSSTTTPRTFDERFLRIREESGVLHAEVSPDATTWRDIDTLAASFPVDDLSVALEIGVPGPTAVAPDVVRFDNFNAQ